MDYAEQTALIAMRAKLALVNRQINELSQAKKTVTLDHSSANAQLILAEARPMRRLHVTPPPHPCPLGFHPNVLECGVVSFVA